MKRIVILLAVLAVGLTTAGLAVAGGRRAKINLRKTKIGKVLVNGSGFTLYDFAKDTRNKDNCVSIPNCTVVWPLVTTSGKAIAGKGVKASLLGTITVSGGRKQVTYAGHPLYTYAGDSAPGQTHGANLPQSGARWYALNAAGRNVK